MSSGNEEVAFEDGGDGYTLVGSLRRNLVVPPCTAWLRERLLREQSESEYNAMKGDLSISPSPQGWEQCGARTRAGREANEADSRRPGNSSTPWIEEFMHGIHGVVQERDKAKVIYNRYLRGDAHSEAVKAVKAGRPIP